ncbi:MAG: hypothetical protein RQ751_01005 [Longimicrobiales bacterium]|nr:hypothetical protein [Longimicrobiales bacterium]
MRWTRIALTGAVALAACSESGLPTAETEAGPPPVARAVSDGANGGNVDFFFLPPLVSNPSPSGVFNGNLAPQVEICELSGGACERVMASFGPEVISVGDASYQFNWNTNGSETLPLDHTLDYRIRVLLGDLEIGFIDVNPQDPNGTTPSENVEGFVSFRLGETLPVKFWLSEGILCRTDTGEFVVECTEGVFTDANGGSLALFNEGVPLGVSLPPGGLPSGTNVVNVRIERLDLPQGVECIDGLDAPVYGPCFQVLTFPELEEPLEIPATVSICADLSEAEFAVLQNHSQDHLLQIHRQSVGGGQIQALTNVFSAICESAPGAASQAGDGSLTRIASRWIQRATRFLGPEPLRAADLGLGGLTRTFSRFQWALPGKLVVEAGDDQVAEVGSAVAVPPTVKVVDALGNPVYNARVHFEVTAGGGSVSLPASARTDVHGAATLTYVPSDMAGLSGVDSWVLNTLGTNTLRAWGNGLLGDGDDFGTHAGDPTAPVSQFDVPEGEVFFNAAACFAGWGTATIDGTLGAEWACANTLEFTANLGNGGVPATAYWMNDGANLYLAVRVSGADKVNSLRFDFDNDGDGVAEAGEDAVNFDPSAGAGGLFTDEFLTAKCSNSSQAGCGALDTSDGGSPDGAGAFTNAGGVTIYELSKPLDSADDTHDFSLGVGSTAGMFWTLRLGNGAKGNTQVPGFRAWLPFTIVGAPGS